MKKYCTLNDNNQFRKVYKRGKSFVHSTLVLYYLKNNSGQFRLGITTSKKIGNAVQRNRARRIIREAFRLLLEENELSLGEKQGYDIVIVARSKTARVKMEVVKQVLKRQLSQAKIL